MSDGSKKDIGVVDRNAKSVEAMNKLLNAPGYSLKRGTVKKGEYVVFTARSGEERYAKIS